MAVFRKICNFEYWKQRFSAPMRVMKKVKIFTGTDIALCSPSHPYSVAVQIKRIVDRIVASSDNEFQYNCNTIEGIEVFEKYGRKVKGLNVQYFINGKPAKYPDVLEDLGRGQKYLSELITPQCK